MKIKTKNEKNGVYPKMSITQRVSQYTLSYLHGSFRLYTKELYTMSYSLILLKSRVSIYRL